jgi:hypothetical protein
MENQPIVRLTFTCNRNWEDMTAVKDGRFCNNCQKKVVDFTDKTNDEIAAYLMNSTTQVCGRFQNTQLASALPKPLWKRWLSAAAMFVTVFIGIKEASAQQQPISVKLVDSTASRSPNSIGEVLIVRNDAQFPGGQDALQNYLITNLHHIKGVHGTLKTTFFVERDGSLTNIKIVKGLNDQANEEAIRVLKESPKWVPRSLYNGTAIKQGYNLLISF